MNSSLRQTQLRTAQAVETAFPVSILQRKCACGQHTIAGDECAACHREGDVSLQRSSINRAPVNRCDDTVPPIVHEVLNSPGRPLDPATQALFEQRFSSDLSDVPAPPIAGRSASSKLSIGAPNDRFEQEADLVTARVMRSPATAESNSFGMRSRSDFAQVRVHNDARAAESARSVNALAYTVGRDVVFGEGQYEPGTMTGNRLLAHELTHVIQQQTGAVQLPVVQRQQKGKGDKGKGGKTTEKKSEPKAASWTRKHKKGPSLMDGESPAYQVWFDHNPPAVPKGATQFWQVVEEAFSFLSGKCESKNEKSFVVDIVDIGKRTAIEDSWGWVPRDDPCFAMNVSKATVGFDDQESGFKEQASAEVSESDAQDLLKKMAGPTGTYSGKYTFVKSSNCTKCPETLKKLQKANGAPNGSALAIDGVGSWTSKSK